MDNQIKYALISIGVVAVLLVALIWLNASYVQNPSQSPSLTPSVSSSPQAGSTSSPQPGSIARLTPLEGIGDIGQGTVARNFDGKSFKALVIVEIVDPDEGKFYEAWLKKSSGVISLGKLEKSNDGIFILTFSTDANYMSYPEVVITQETSAKGLDSVMETALLSGKF